jgi:hypothetical protein
MTLKRKNNPLPFATISTLTSSVSKKETTSKMNSHAQAIKPAAGATHLRIY